MRNVSWQVRTINRCKSVLSVECIQSEELRVFKCRMNDTMFFKEHNVLHRLSLIMLL